MISNWKKPLVSMVYTKKYQRLKIWIQRAQNATVPPILLSAQFISGDLADKVCFFQFEIIITVFPDSSEYLCYRSTAITNMFYSYSAGIDSSRQNLTSTDVRFWRLELIPALWGLNTNHRDCLGINPSLAELSLVNFHPLEVVCRYRDP